MKKKVLAWMLSVFMAVTMMPLPAFATETGVDPSTDSTMTTEIDETTTQPEGQVPEEETGTTEGGEVTEEDSFVTEDDVAKIGNKGYETLQEAIDAASNDTIKLLHDISLSEGIVIPAGKTITLDLKGKTISQEKACSENYSMILNKGNLTITGNGKISFNDTGVGDPNFGWGTYTLRNEGTLVVENGTIEHLGQQNAGGTVKHMYCAIFQYSGSTTINGGTISTPTYRSVRLWKGDMTITGGTFEGQVWIQSVDDTAKMDITGGTFAPRGVDGSSVFVGNVTETGVLCDVDFSVRGGKFTTKIGASNPEAVAGAITGGTFSENAQSGTNAALLGKGLAFNENGEVDKAPLPEAEIKNLGRVEATTKYVYDGSFREVAEQINLQVAMEFIAQEDSTAASENAYADYITDFYIKIDGIEEDTLIADGCYLAGYYGDWEWVKVPIDGLTVEKGITYPIMSSVGAFFTYEDICSLVKDFKCGIYFTDKILEENPNMTVELQLGLSENKDAAQAAEFVTVGELYVYDVADMMGYVAEIDGQGYETLQAAIDAAKEGDVIEIIAEEITFDENAASIAVDKAVTIKGHGKDATKLVFNSASSAFVVKSSNVTFQDMTIVQGTKDNSFHISIDKGVWDAPAIQYSDITIKNIEFVGGDYALCLIGEDVVVDGCSFTDQDSHNILVYSLKGDSKIINNTFNASKGNNKSAILWEGGADNATDLSKFTGSGTLTIDGNTANGKGVFFQFTSWGHVKDMNVEITNNKVDAFTNKAIALYTENAEAASGDEFASFVVKENVFTNIPEGKTIVKEYTGTVAVDASANYLGSETPDYEALLVGDKVAVDSYYSDEAKETLVKVVNSLEGSGTAENPYLISTADELFFFAKKVNDGTYKNVSAKLTADIDLEQEDWTSIGTSTNPFTGTFDGNGKTISNIWSYERGLFGYTSTGNYVDSGKNGRATIKDLTIKGVEVYNQSTSAVGGLVGQAGQNTEITNVTVTGYISIYGYGYVGGLVGQGYVHVDKCNVIGVNNEDGDISTIDANYWAVAGIVGHAGSEGGSSITNCTVENVKIDSAIYGAGSIAGVGTTGTIENVSAKDVSVVAGSDADANGVLVGCNYDKITGNSTATNVKLTVGGTEVEAVQDMVAKVDDTYYATFDSAIAAADNKTVKLINDVSTSDTFKIEDGNVVTLDLNGKTITATDNKASGSYEVFLVLGELAVTGNGTIELTATTDRDWNAYSAIFHNRGGKLTIENGTFTHGGGSDMAYVVNNSANSYGDATTDIKGGKLTSSYIGIRNYMDTYGANGTPGNGIATLNISGGEISGKYAVWGQVATTGVKGAINISGGTLTGAEGKDALLVDEDTTGVITTAVSGGTFSSPIPDEYCAEGFIPTKNSDGTYGVKAGSYAVQVGDKKFETLTEALKAIKSGDTLTLLSDITITENWDARNTGAKITVPVTIDGNEHTIKFTSTIDDKNYFAVFRFEDEATVKNLTIDMSEAQGTNNRFRAISAKTGLTVDNCNFIGNSAVTNTRAIIFGEGAGTAIGEVDVTITNSTFENWKRGVGDNENAQDAKTVTITGNTFTNANVNVSAAEKVVFNGNTMNNSWANITSYKSADKLNVEATGNTLSENSSANYNAISNAKEVNAQEGFMLPAVQVGEKTYFTLAEAFNKAADGDVVTVIRDIATSDPATVSGKAIVLDLNGKTIAGTDTATASFGLININPGAKLTVKDSGEDGKITLEATNDRDWNAYSSVISNQRGTLVVEGGTIEHLGGTDMAYAIDNLTNGKETKAETTINGGTVKSTYRAIRQFLNGVDAENILTVNGGTIEGTNKSIWMQDPSANANSGTLTVSKKADLYGDVYLSVTEGSTEWPVEVSVADAALMGDSTVTSSNVPEGYEVKVVDKAYTVVAIQAAIGDECYATVQDAIDAAKAGDTVKVLVNVDLEDTLTIPEGKEVILDLNGNTISQTKACTAHYTMIENKGDLTITGNGKISFTDTGTGDAAATWGSYTIYNIGTLIVENGTIENLSEQNQIGQPFAHTSLAIFQYSGSTTINDGTISTPNYRSVRLWKGDMTINGGTFDGQTWFHCVDDSAKLTINGGSFSPNGNDGSSVFVNNTGYDVEFAVTGGTFETKIGANDVEALAGSITGGNFTEAAKSKTNEALIAEGMVFSGVADADGYYTLVETEKVAKIGDKEFDSLKKAIAAAEDGDTIELIADHKVNTADRTYTDSGYAFIVVEGKSVTIDLAGHVLSAENNNAGYIDGIFGVMKGGKLTIKDSSADKTGTVKMGAGYALILNYGALGTGLETTLTIDGGNYKLDTASNSLIFAYKDGPVVVNGGNFELGNVATGENGSPWIFNVAGQNVHAITINGGTYNDDVSNQHWAFEAQLGEGKAIKANENGTWTVYEAVANVTYKTWVYPDYDWREITKGYASFEEAIEAANTASKSYADTDIADEAVTVTLLESIELDNEVKVDGNIVLDLNNKTISGTHGSDYSMIHVLNGAELTVKDTSAEQNGKITYAAGGNNTGANVWVEGKLTLESGTIEVTGAWSLGFAVDLRPNAWGTAHTVGASFIMNGGTVKSTDTAVRIASNSSDSHDELGVTFTMNDGTIDSTWDAIFVQHLYNGDLNVDVLGGNVSGDNSVLRIYGDNAGSDIDMNVENGNFNGEIKVADAYAGTDAIEISGGIFDKPVKEDYCAEGYIPCENADGTYGVVQGEYVAAVGDEKHATLQDALYAAEAGTVKTVTLLVDHEEGSIIVPAGVTLDLAGKKLEAKYFVSFGQVADNSEDNTGVLVSSNIMMQQDNKQVPIKNAELGGYQFFVVTKFLDQEPYSKDGKTGYAFKPYFEEAANELILAGKSTSGMSIVARVDWKDTAGETHVQDFVYTDTNVSNLINLGNMFTLFINNKAENTEYNYTGVIKTELGVEISVDSYKVTE